MSRPFTDILGELAAGETLQIFSADLAEVVTAVRATGKKGTIRLDLEVNANGAHGVRITDKITVKAPREDRGETLFFSDADGNLHRRDPRQQTLPLREVGGTTHDPETGEVKT